MISERRPFARLPVGVVAAAIVALLLALNGRYDYHRDELYFRVLGRHPAWGYVDQPPFTPLVSRLAIAVFGDSVWAVRVPGTIMIAVATILTALIAREAGGGRTAQTLAALGLASAFPLIAGHVLSTATADLVVWLLVCLFVMRALLRDRPRYWLAAGVSVGLGLYNKQLVLLLLLMLAVGLLLVGPRRVLLSPWVLAGVAVAVVIGSPNLIYQLVNGLPQLKMAQALSGNKGSDARVTLIPLQLILLGLFTVPISIRGLVALLRESPLRPARAFAVAYLGMLVLLFIVGGQPYYTLGLLITVYAVGCVPVARWMHERRPAQLLVAVLMALNVAISAVIALPLIPVGALHRTPIPALNQVTRDQIGWQTYVRQIAGVFAGLPPADRTKAVIVTGNYGELGAVDRYGRRYGLPPVYSGQNQLWYLGPPPDSATVVLLVIEDARPATLAARFASCAKGVDLDNGLGVDNEEQSAAVWVCRDPRPSWGRLWPSFQHFD